jgi:putative SOS response-associated peptidase YedK
MCNLYSITTNQAAIIALFRVNRYVGNLAPMPGVFPDYPAPVIRNTDTGTEIGTMRWGMPPPPRTAAGHQHPQHVVAALAWLAQAGEPMPCPCQQLRRIRARAEPGDQEKGRGVVRVKRRTTAGVFRRNLD